MALMETRAASLPPRPAPRRGSLTLAALVIAAVTMLIVPIPTAVLDGLLVLNLALALGVVLATLSTTRALELSTFPALLVLTTLFRLALNVSSVRLILLKADAGRVIHAFGSLLVRGDVLTGLALFLILALVQYLVIARGAERIAEVAARFSLDALPGRQVEIDAELRDGHISLEAARRRRQDLQREAHLYGSLDGAMRFVRGDAVAGLVILAVALLGGLGVGILERDMAPMEAVRLYSVLTIGDGLVTQIPALLLSIAAGLVVTQRGAVAAGHPSSDSEEAAGGLGAELATQLFQPRVLRLTAAACLALALLPGLPAWPFAAVGLGLGMGAILRQRTEEEALLRQSGLVLEPMPLLELGLEPHLLASVPQLGSRVSDAIAAFGADLGVPLPGLRIVGAPALPLRGYRVRLRGTPLTAGVIPDGKVLVPLSEERIAATADAVPTLHPVTGHPAAWISASRGAKLSREALDPASVVSLEATTALRRNVVELVGLEETRQLLDRLAEECPALVCDLVPRRFDLPTVAAILRRLAEEGLSLRDLRTVLEGLAASGAPTGEPPRMELLVARVRRALRRQISHRFASEGHLEALVLDPMIEEALLEDADLESELGADVVDAVARAHSAHPRAALVTSERVRARARALLAESLPLLPVLAYDELLPELEIRVAETVRPPTA